MRTLIHPFSLPYRGWVLLRERRAAAVLGCLAVVFLALSLAIHSPSLLGFDLAATASFQAFRTPALDGLAITLSRAGDGMTLCAVAALQALLLVFSGRTRAALISLAALLTLPANMLLKGWFARPRPDAASVEIILPALGLSYPSGHAMASVVVYGVAAVMLWIHGPRTRARGVAVLLVATLVLGISLSRIYLGAHWLSDVTGGWTAGLFLLLLLTHAYRRFAPGELTVPSRSA